MPWNYLFCPTNSQKPKEKWNAMNRSSLWIFCCLFLGNTFYPSYLCHSHCHSRFCFIHLVPHLFGGLFMFTWFYNMAVFVLVSPATHLTSVLFFTHLYLSCFFFALFLCAIYFLPPALLPELVTNVPVQRLVKHLYSTLGCVITFNPLPFLFCSLSQRRRLFSSVFSGNVSRGMGSNSCSTSLISGGRWRCEETRDCVYLSSLPSGRHLFIYPSLAKESRKGNKTRNA